MDYLDTLLRSSRKTSSKLKIDAFPEALNKESKIPTAEKDELILKDCIVEISSKLDHHEATILSTEKEIDLLWKTVCSSEDLRTEIRQTTKETNEITREIHATLTAQIENTIRSLEAFKKETKERISTLQSKTDALLMATLAENEILKTTVRTLTEEIATIRDDRSRDYNTNAMLMATLAENEILKNTTRTLTEDVATMRADIAYFRENVLQLLNSSK